MYWLILPLFFLSQILISVLYQFLFPMPNYRFKDMEEELGKQLFIRSNRKITLTEEGMILRKRAEVSGDKVSVTEDLDRDLVDFELLLGEIDLSKYECLKIPYQDSFGVLIRRDSPLAKKETIASEDLWDKPLIVSRQAIRDASLPAILGCSQEKLNIAASYNLLFNGSLMVDEGIGYAICLDKIINVTGNSNLCFRPLSQKNDADMHIVWKKYQVFTKAAEKYLL